MKLLVFVNKAGKLIFLTLVLLLLPFFESCVRNDSIIIRYAHVGVNDEPQSRFAEEVAKIVNSQTNNRVQIMVYPNSQLGNISELCDGVKYGFIGMSHHDFASLGKFNKDLAVFNAPYIYRDVNHALKATNPNSSTVLYKINQELIEKSGIRIIGSFYRGTRQLTANIPVYTVDDLKGKKIRGVPLPVWMSMIRGMGAIPTAVEYSELTTALMTNMVSGQENPLSNIYASKIYEVQSHIIMTNHMHSCLCVFINEKLWERINVNDQEIIMNAISKVSSMAANWIIESDQKIKNELISKGMIFIDEKNGLDLDNIKSSVQRQIKADFPEWKEYIKEIQKIE